uniref:DUF4057 domain-containing protein n=1 Tax=Mesocestoides corti TaxID=53468 RepID=A0A5K3G2L4_MESCO
MSAAAGEKESCRSAALENAARSRSDSEPWFAHDSSSTACGPRGQQAVSYKAAGIIDEYKPNVGYARQLANTNENPKSVSETLKGRRLRTEEAILNAQRMIQSTDKWSDFEGNASIKSEPRAQRFGTNKEAKEIQKSHTCKCDWFVHDTEVNLRPKTASPTGTQTSVSTCDWFAHCEVGPPTIDEKNHNFCRRFRAEGIEYALRNQGHENLLKTTPLQYSTEPPNHSPTQEARRFYRKSNMSKLVAECLKSNDMNEESQHFTAPVHLNNEDAIRWRNRGTLGSLGRSIFQFDAGSLVEFPSKKKRPIPPSQMARIIAQSDNDATPHQKHQAYHGQDKPKALHHNNPVDQMDELIGKHADSTTLNYPSKNRVKTVNSEDARTNQEKSRGSAVHTLMTHSNLSPLPPRRPTHTPLDRVGLAIGGRGFAAANEASAGVWAPRRRLASAEARLYAQKQSGTVQNLIYLR